MPHEIIKKIFWFIHSPKFLKLRIQLALLIRSTFGVRNAVIATSDASNEDHASSSNRRRATVMVSLMLDDIGDSIIGGQVFEYS